MAHARVLELLRWWGWKRALGGLFGALGIALVVYFAVRVEPPPVEQSIPMPLSLSTSTPSTFGSLVLTVHVGGEVMHPGVYSLPGGSRVVDAVTAAGGVTTKAYTDAINLAAPLVDSVQVIVPRKGSVVAQRTAEPAGPQDPAGRSLVNINTASVNALDELPGVGPATAKAIVETRSSKGPFATADDLLDVPGIGPAKLAQIRPLITW